MFTQDQRPPDELSLSSSWSWSDNDGELGDTIRNNVSKGQSILNVKASDGYVEVRGCEFTKAA